MTAEFTPDEVAVMRLLAAGTSEADAAVTLGVSRYRVAVWVRSAMDRVQARNRTQLLTVALRAGLLEDVAP